MSPNKTFNIDESINKKRLFDHYKTQFNNEEMISRIKQFVINELTIEKTTIKKSIINKSIIEFEKLLLGSIKCALNGNFLLEWIVCDDIIENKNILLEIELRITGTTRFKSLQKILMEINNLEKIKNIDGITNQLKNINDFFEYAKRDRSNLKK